MNTDRIEVFHVTDGNTVIIGITDYFIFYFFPACHTAFNQCLTDKAVFQTSVNDFIKFFFVSCNTAASTTQSISRSDDKWEANFISKFLSCTNCLNDCTFRNRLIDFLHCFFEKFAVFCPFDTFNLSAKKLDIVFCQNTFFIKVHSKVQSNLSAQRSQERIRTFFSDNTFQKFAIQRFNINTVSNINICHNCCRIAVNKHYFKIFFFESTTCLRTCIVKLCRLSNDNRAGADYEYFFNVCFFRHLSIPPSFL